MLLVLLIRKLIPLGIKDTAFKSLEISRSSLTNFMHLVLFLHDSHLLRAKHQKLRMEFRCYKSNSFPAEAEIPQMSRASCVWLLLVKNWTALPFSLESRCNYILQRGCRSASTAQWLIDRSRRTTRVLFGYEHEITEHKKINERLTQDTKWSRRTTN